MMKKKIKNENLNVSKSILAELHHLIQDEYKAGGRLPSSREMCKKYNISPPTYGKAVRNLMTEGFAYKDSNKGIYIYPDGYITHKIGIVLDYAKESPFFGHCGCLSSFLEELFAAGYNVQLIQASSPEMIQTTAELYCVRALVFLHPEKPLYPYIHKITKMAKFPVLTVHLPDPANEDSFLPPECILVSKDYLAEGRQRVNVFREYGFTSVAYAGCSPWFVNYMKIPEVAAQAGISVYLERPLDSIPSIQMNLRGVVKKKKIQAIYVEGGLFIALSLAKELCRLKPEQRPALIFSHFLQFPFFASHHPECNCLGTCNTKCTLLGQYASQMLIRHLKEGLPFKSASLDTFRFLPL